MLLSSSTLLEHLGGVVPGLGRHPRRRVDVLGADFFAVPVSALPPGLRLARLFASKSVRSTTLLAPASAGASSSVVTVAVSPASNGDELPAHVPAQQLSITHQAQAWR